MELERFEELLNKSESDSVILKLESKVLCGYPNEDASLIRDIISLANRGESPGYIIIGVETKEQSQDGVPFTFKTVTNPNLTEESISSFCHENISPQPVVKITKVKYEEDQRFQETEFVIIQVGPQPVQCFRFRREYVDFSVRELAGRVCHRKNEVWVRRSGASELATPEEIRLLVEGKSPQQTSGKVKHATGVNYLQLAKGIVLPAMLSDLKVLAEKTGGKIFSEADPFRKGSECHHLVFSIEGNPVILRIIIVEKCSNKAEIREIAQNHLVYEHGLFLISLGKVAPEAVEASWYVSREFWGWFGTREYWHPSLRDRNLDMILPAGIKEKIGEPASLYFVLSTIENTHSLQRAWHEMLDTVRTKLEIRQIVTENQGKVNAALLYYLKEECPRLANKSFIPKKLLANEIYDADKYGNTVMVKQPEIAKAIYRLLEKIRS